MHSRTAQCRDSYDRVAARYAAEFRDELAHKPFDRKMLDWLAERCTGMICDLGCGPGQVAAYLHARGASVCGIDLSAEMVACARREHAAIAFRQGNLLSMDEVAGASFGGIAAFYAIVHVAGNELDDAFAEIYRVLAPGGVLLLAFHSGDEVISRSEWWGEPVCVDFIFHQSAAVKRSLTNCGFAILEALERDPYPGVEYPSRRAYLFAQKP